MGRIRHLYLQANYCLPDTISRAENGLEAEQGHKETLPPAQSSEIHGQIGRQGLPLWRIQQKGFSAVNEKTFSRQLRCGNLTSAQETWRKSGNHGYGSVC